MRNLILAPVLALFLVGCAGTSSDPSVGMAAACQAFSNALGTATVFKSKMSVDTIAAVDQAIIVAQPACHAFRDNPETATPSLVNSVRDALRTIVLANQEAQS